MSALQNVPGTWKIGGWTIPDFGLTELARMLAGKTASAERTTTYNNPNVIRATGGGGTGTASGGITTKTTTSPAPSNGNPTNNNNNNNNNNSGDSGNSNGPSYEQQIANSREQALNSLKARLGVVNNEIDTGKVEALKNRDIMTGNIGNAFGIRQTGDWGNPQYNDISIGTGTPDEMFNEAQKKWYDPNSPNSLLSQLFNTLSTGKSTLAQEKTGVENLYGDANAGTGLMGAAKNTQQTQDRALNTEDVNTINKYSNAGGIARRAMKSAMNKNRISARAGGRLGSSFYDQLQGDVTNTAAKSISDIGLEEAGKRTDISGKRTDLQNLLTGQLDAYVKEKKMKGEAIDTKVLDMFREMAGTSGNIKTGATNEYQKTGSDYTKAVNEANKLKALNDINYGDLEAGVENNYMTGLNNIQTYLQNKDLQNRAMLANAGGYNTGYNVYTPTSKGNPITTDISKISDAPTSVQNETSKVQSLLNDIQTINPARDTAMALPNTYNDMMAGLNTGSIGGTNLEDILAMLGSNLKKKNPLDQFLNYA